MNTQGGAGCAVAGRAVPHDAAEGHVCGAAPYLDDLPVAHGTLHAALGLSPEAHGMLRGLNLSAVRSAPGVAAVASAADIPGDPDIGPVSPGDPLLAADRVEYCGQPVFAVAAATFVQARRAARLGSMRIDRLPAVLTVEQALREGSFLFGDSEPPRIERGWSEAKLAASPHTLEGEMHIGGQEHFYLEGQAACAVPQEGGGMSVVSSTQHPSEVQHAVAGILGLPMHCVEVSVRRMGGGFGGKETQGAQTACLAALLASMTGRPVKLRLPRADDFAATGKRHPFLARWRTGFDGSGRILALDMTLVADCGMSADLSMAILERSLFHADNAYHLPCVRVTGMACRTHKASNTAFRGFGGPQGMIAIERVVEDIARSLGADPLAVRKANLYRGCAQLTPYHQQVRDNILPQLVEKLAASASYRARRKAVDAHNCAHHWTKRGLALTPVKFGISFTTGFLNQAGALVHVYHDGSVHLNHGGTEMGQGLFVKVAQVVADELGVALQTVRCSATCTGKVPNTSATAASAGADLNGMAARAAARKLRVRLTNFAARQLGAHPDEMVFSGGRVSAGKKSSLSFAQLARQAYLARIPLSATGYYRTPKIHFDRSTWRGRPFYYFAYGAAVTEVALDVLTGENRLLRVDILHDAGKSINPAVDLGQIEGGFVQGAGWLTSEELAWSGEGKLTTAGPATYKIPSAGDVPAKFRVDFWQGDNREATVFRSKAVGEPPLMLAISVWSALADAVSAASGGGREPVLLDAPATPERVLLEICARQQRREKAVYKAA